MEQKLDCENNLLLKDFHWIFQDMKISYHKQVSHENIQL